VDTGRSNRSEHFFVYLPHQVQGDAVGVQESVIGCQKVKINEGDKSAAKAVDQLKNFYQLNGMKKKTASSAVHNIKHRPDNLHSVNAMSTQHFEEFAMAALHMPMIGSLDQLVDLNESTEIIRQHHMKKAFEADGEMIENALIKNDNFSTDDFSQTEIATEVTTKKT
jgi:hypothetical protein